MNERIGRSAGWCLAILGLCLFFPSSAKVQRFLGMAWVPVYLLGVGAALVIGYRYLLAKCISWLSAKTVWVLAVSTLLLIVAGFVVIYPVANSGRVGGGSDREEAVNAGVSEILHGRYPYYARTEVAVHPAGEDWVYRGPLSQMPGELFFAVPFVLLGNSAYQNFFWLAVLFLTLRWFFGDGRDALLLVWVAVFLSPVCLHEAMSGGDLLANSIWVFVITVIFVRIVPDARMAAGAKTVVAVLLGMALSSRINFLLIGPLVLSMLVQTSGWKTAVRYMAVVAAAFLAVTLPFYFYDPENFTPLWLIRTRIGQYSPILPPLAQSFVSGSYGVLAIALSFMKMDRRGVRLFAGCAIVLAWPVLAEVVLTSIMAGCLDLERRAWYGLSSLFFGVMACWIVLPRAGDASAPKGEQPSARANGSSPLVP